MPCPPNGLQVLKKTSYLTRPPRRAETRRLPLKAAARPQAMRE